MDIPMNIKCAPLPIDLFPYTYEEDVMHGFLNKKKPIEANLVL